jgi:hypothetical protein
VLSPRGSGARLERSPDPRVTAAVTRRRRFMTRRTDMRIGIVGGMDRNARDLEAVAVARGHALETHTGVIGGSSSAESLRALVARADLVFLLTDVNSHNAVHVARRTARLHGVPLRIVRRLGPTHLASYLTLLSAGAPSAGRASA